MELQKRPKTPWHPMITSCFVTACQNNPITIHPEKPIMAEPPVVDMVIMLWEYESPVPLDEARWMTVPDGVWDSPRPCVMVELKVTESCNDGVMSKSDGGRQYYSAYATIPVQYIQCVVMCFRTPQKKKREEMGFTIQRKPGVYASDSPGRKHMTLVVVNELRDEVQNLYVKMFSQQKKVREAAYAKLMHDPSVPFALKQQALDARITYKRDKQKGKTMSERLQNELNQLPKEFILRIIQNNKYLQEQIAQSKQTTLIETINSIISLRFGGTVGTFDAQLHTLDTTTLETLRDNAILLSNLAEFAAMVEQAAGGQDPVSAKEEA